MLIKQEVTASGVYELKDKPSCWGCACHNVCKRIEAMTKMAATLIRYEVTFDCSHHSEQK